MCLAHMLRWGAHAWISDIHFTCFNVVACACVHACVMPLHSLIIAGLTPTGQMAVWCSSFPRTVCHRHTPTQTHTQTNHSSAQNGGIFSRRAVSSLRHTARGLNTRNHTHTHMDWSPCQQMMTLMAKKSTLFCLHSARLSLKHSCGCFILEWLHSPSRIYIWNSLCDCDYLCIFVAIIYCKHDECVLRFCGLFFRIRPCLLSNASPKAIKMFSYMILCVLDNVRPQVKFTKEAYYKNKKQKIWWQV